MKIYSDGKSRSLNGAFPRRFRLMNAGKEVPFIRTGRESIRISGELPIGELDIQELVLPKKEPEIKAEKLDVGNVAIVNKADVERLDVMTKTLDKNTNRIEEQMNFIAGQEKVLSDLETQNAQSIELLSGQTASAVQMLKGAIDDAEKKNNAVQKALNKAISETSEDLSDSLVAHETANNPHRITKATIGLDKVENIRPEDMPMTKEVKNAIDKKADKESIKELKKKIDEAAKSQKNVEKGIERLNWVGGVGGNEIPSGGKKGQLLGKASNKTGDYTWVDAESGIEIKRVDVLPDTGDSGKLYLVPSSDPQTSNVYDEYIWTDNGSGTYAWEKIGSTEIDLSGYVTTDTAQDITAPKTMKALLKLQNGDAGGCLVVGADVSATTVTANTRKLGRMSFHTYESTTLNCAWLSTDSTSGLNQVEFGGRIGDVTCTSPDEIKFIVAEVHNTTTSSEKKEVAKYTKDNVDFYAQPRYNGNNLLTSASLSGYLTTADIVSSVDSSSTNSKAVGAKLFYDTCGDIETLINAL